MIQLYADDSMVNELIAHILQLFKMYHDDGKRKKNRFFSLQCDHYIIPKTFLIKLDDIRKV